jgi:hypothetical protein
MSLLRTAVIRTEGLEHPLRTVSSSRAVSSGGHTPIIFGQTHRVCGELKLFRGLSGFRKAVLFDRNLLDHSLAAAYQRSARTA